VAAAVAAVREDAPGQTRLVGYLVPAAPERAPEVEAVRRLLKSKLPPYMIPSHFVVLEALPVTANGKLDRGGLPAPDGSRPQAERGYVAPEGSVQETLAEVWGEVLGLSRVGIDDDFFELGGHSMLAVKMLGRVQEVLGVQLYVRDLFECSTIRELSEPVTAQLLREVSDDELADLLAEMEVER
jgi:acyl carrier protein